MLVVVSVAIILIKVLVHSSTVIVLLPQGENMSNMTTTTTTTSHMEYMSSMPNPLRQCLRISRYSSLNKTFISSQG